MSNTQKDFWFTAAWIGVPTIVGAVLVAILANKAVDWIGSYSILIVIGLALGGFLDAVSGWIYLGISADRKNSRFTTVWIGVPTIVGAILVAILASQIADWISSNLVLMTLGLVFGGLLGSVCALLLLVWLLSEDD